MDKVCWGVSNEGGFYKPNLTEVSEVELENFEVFSLPLDLSYDPTNYAMYGKPRIKDPVKGIIRYCTEEERKKLLPFLEEYDPAFCKLIVSMQEHHITLGDKRYVYTEKDEILSITDVDEEEEEARKRGWESIIKESQEGDKV